MSVRQLNRKRVIGTAILVCLIGASVAAQTGKASMAEWKPLFDGSSLEGWRETPFSGRGKVAVEKGAIVLGRGLMTGITWKGVFLKFNYEVRLEAMRVDGHDFFAGIARGSTAAEAE